MATSLNISETGILHITWIGVDKEELNPGLREKVITNIMEYSGGAPLRVKVILTKSETSDDVESVRLMRIGNEMYLHVHMPI